MLWVLVFYHGNRKVAKTPRNNGTNLKDLKEDIE